MSLEAFFPQVVLITQDVFPFRFCAGLDTACEPNIRDVLEVWKGEDERPLDHDLMTRKLQYSWRAIGKRIPRA